MRKQIEQHIEELEALTDSAAISDLVASIAVDDSGVVTFTIPASYQGKSEWSIEFKGRAEFDGFGGISIHNALDRIELKPGMHYTYDLSEQWSGITELYLSVSLGTESQDINLLDSDGADTADTAPAPWPHGVSELCYVRDYGGFGGKFNISLEADGTFTYFAGLFSSYIGKGTWTREGDILCLADKGMQNTVNYYYFKVVEDALIFQKENSAEFMYVDAADGDRFSCRPIASEPVEE